MVCDSGNRRRWPRLIPIDRRARLGWWKAGSFRVSTARIENISAAGTVVEADALPPKDAAVWICPVVSGEGGWVEAELRPAMIRPRGPHRLRLIFKDRKLGEQLFEKLAINREAGSEAGSEEEGSGPPRSMPDGPSADALATLELGWPCSKAELKQAYHRIAMREHPDHGGSPDAFIRVQFAYKAVMERFDGTGAGTGADRAVSRR